MKYALSIRQKNIRPHLDIEKDIQAKGNGLFTFNLRIHEGNIEDYAQYETVTIASYVGVIFTTITECSPSLDNREGSGAYAVRPDKRQRGD